MVSGVRFSIVTPSLRQLEFLKLSARSIADQGVECEHVVQDGGTGAALEDWVRAKTTARLFVEPDAGIYDALNRGFGRATGDVFAWLNCDEQYLPGALAAVASHFEKHPGLDVVLADNLIVDARGGYVAHRFSLAQSPWETSVRFAVSSCALFFRRAIWQPFDTRWKSAGDWWWYVAMLRAGARVGVLRQFVAAFAETGENLGLSPVTAMEQGSIIAARPWWVRAFLPLLLLRHRLRMRASGVARVAPFSYSLHTPESPGRITFRAPRPTSSWRRPLGSHRSTNRR
jgi:glycosyltransferase involved in cell wall biosynthesis